MSTHLHIPLDSVELRARNHGILSTVGYLILLPIGVLVARYSRTLPYKWFWVHWIIQFGIAGPIIFAAYAQGYKTSTMLGLGHFKDPHQKMGLAIFILYICQILLGVVVHFFKCPSFFRGYRPPHSYIHVVLGLTIIICAQWQVHYGLYTEWTVASGGLHKVVESAKRAWLALVILCWVLYVAGFAFLPRQFKQERRIRKTREAEGTAA